MLDIHVGPTWYLKQQDYAFAGGEHIEVIGSRLKYHGSDVVIARQIKQGGNMWTFRNEQGVPLWRRAKRP